MLHIGVCVIMYSFVFVHLQISVIDVYDAKFQICERSILHRNSTNVQAQVH
jgi:hypothetical protein